MDRVYKKHPCQDCGEMVHQAATRCRHCNIKYFWSSGIFSRTRFMGEKHWNWKGGEYISHSKRCGTSYRFLLKPEHPRANKDGYVQEHIVVWEQVNGRELPKRWSIHHLNGIGIDNRPSNLLALPNRKHSLLLQAKSKRIQELEALLNNQHQLL